MVADFGASQGRVRQTVKAVKGAALPTQLYKGALEAIAKLSKEKADRKALVILGDGNSDDTSYDHEPVMKAAKEAGVIIHALGFAAEPTDQPKFQYIQRLADETGGFRREVRVGSSQKYTISNQFVGEALENGGTAMVSLKEPPGHEDAQHDRRLQQRPLRQRAAGHRRAVSAAGRARAADRPRAVCRARACRTAPWPGIKRYSPGRGRTRP